MRDAINPAGDDADSIAIENAIFEMALQLEDPMARREFLDRTFHRDPQGRTEMELLLGMTESASIYFVEARMRTAELAQEVLAELPDLIFE